MKDKLDDDIDALFRLPLAEFTSARNALATQLKKSGRHNEADRVKLLTKPSISAWAVNQLYWNHRQVFDQLIATGKRFGRGQFGKVANMRESLDARRESLARLSDLAARLLRDAGHNPTPETLRRITTTLESLSNYALLPDGPTPGRLTQDVDPPSFESLASLMSVTGTTKRTEEPPRVKSGTASSSTRPKATITDVRRLQDASEARRLQEVRQEKIAAAKVSLQEAKRSLSDARARAQGLDAAQKRANAEVREAEKQKREAEERRDQATAASADATRALEDAKRLVEEATKELESLLRSPVKD